VGRFHGAPCLLVLAGVGKRSLPLSFWLASREWSSQRVRRLALLALRRNHENVGATERTPP
jgi:hypothetical protein